MLKRSARGQTRKHRLRKFFRLRAVRVTGALILVFFVWVAFSVGQALLAPNGGSMSAKLAEWARDHYLGPVVTFGEWLTYSPPKVGGKPSFSLAVPSSQAVAPSPRSAKPWKVKAREFQAVVPATAGIARRQAAARRGPVAGAGEGPRRAGGVRDLPAGRDLHVLRKRDRLHGPAARLVPAAPRQRGSRRQRLGAELPAVDTAGLADRPACHVQRRVQARQRARAASTSTGTRRER